MKCEGNQEQQKMFLLWDGMVIALTFGVLEQSLISCAPATTVRPHGLVQLLQPTHIFVCCDNDCRVHYFLQKNSTLTRCVWSDDDDAMGLFDKTRILRGLRKWHEDTTRWSSSTMFANMVDAEDLEAWDAADGLWDL